MNIYKCDICGRPLNKKIRLYGHTLCSKHMHQFLNHGHALDDNPRTVQDLNDYEILDGETAKINLYNQKCDLVGSALVDLDMLESLKYNKWRLGHSHVVTGSGAGNIREMSHIVLGIPKEEDCNTVVDHISGDALDNRKCNLRICTQAENTLNKRFMSNNKVGVIGVSYDKDRDAWASEIRRGKLRIHLPRQKALADAVWQRIVAEDLLFDEFVNAEGRERALAICADMDDARKEELRIAVTEKVSKKCQEIGLWP